MNCDRRSGTDFLLDPAYSWEPVLSGIEIRYGVALRDAVIKTLLQPTADIRIRPLAKLRSE